MIGTIAASVSTLLTTVGQSQAPLTAGKGGLIRGLPCFPSNDSSNRRLFAADIGTRTRMNINFAIETRPKDILPEPPISLRLRNRLLQDLRYPRILTPGYRYR